MQYYVPTKNPSKRKKHNIMTIISLSLVVVFIIILVIIIPTKKADKYFKQKEYYFVYAVKNDNEIFIEPHIDIIKSLGGAGFSYLYKNEFYLLVNVYLDKSSAEDVKQGMVQSYGDADYLTLKSKLISKSVISKVKKNENAIEFAKFLYDFIDMFESLQMSYLSGKISDSKLCSELISKKLEIEAIIKDCSNAEMDELTTLTLKYANLCQVHFKNFFDKFFESTKKHSLVCNFFVNLIFAKLEFYDNL